MSPTATRSKRRDEARGERRAHEAAVERAALRRRAYTQLIGVALASAAIVLALIAAGNATRPDRAPASPAAAAVSSSRFDGIPQRGTVLGSPAAPVTVTEYADLQCPFCADFDRDQLAGIVDRYVRTGNVKLDLQLLAFLGGDSVKGARAAAEAASANSLWQFADRFFRQQGVENSGFVTDEFLRSIDPATVGADAAQGDRAIAAAQAHAKRDRVTSTPSFVVGGREVQAAQLEQAIKAQLSK